MAGKAGQKQKHTPYRTCVGCREVNTKRRLIRIVRTPEGVFLDPTGRLNGRGAYLHNDLSCWEKGLKGPLSGALRMEFSLEDWGRLKDFAATLKPAPQSVVDEASE